MKLGILSFLLGMSIASYGQVDTLYYDAEWKGVTQREFASYLRIIPKNVEEGYRKYVKDYFITGELQGEGQFITIDKFDDSKSVFDGVNTTYFKNGKVQSKRSYTNGILNGEATQYAESGLVKTHVVYMDGKPHGVYTEFTDDGNLCFQKEYSYGNPVNSYYTASNKDGLCSVINDKDNTPVYISPDYSEKKVEYIRGAAWPYYNKNGIMVGMTNTQVKDYGKYYRIEITIANNSLFPFDFDPQKITSTLSTKKGETKELKVYSADDYMRKVRRRQNWNMALMGLAEGMAAASAGYSQSTTNTSYSGHSNTYGSGSVYGTGGYAHGSYSGSSNYYGSSHSTTTTYNGYAAYQAQVIASNRMADYQNSLLSEREAKDAGYFKLTTIHPGETITGYVNIDRVKGESMEIIIDIQGALYRFNWNVTK